MGKRDGVIDIGKEARRRAREVEKKQRLFGVVAAVLTQRVILDKRRKPAKHRKPLRGDE